VSRSEARSLNRELKSIPKNQRAHIVTIANTKGAKAAQVEIAKVKNKNVIAKATGKGVNTVREIDGAIKKLKSKAVQAQAKAAGKGAVDALDAAVKKLKTRRVEAAAKASGKAQVDALYRSINNLHGKSVTVTTRRVTLYETRGRAKAGKGSQPSADGGTLPYPEHAGGGTVRGWGGPREDNIAAIDRATGQQIAWVSATEEVVNARQAALNRPQIKQINAGGLWDVVPRHADGGTVATKAKPGTASTATSGQPRTLTLNINMGEIMGGIRQFVIDLQDDRDEYTATVGRMH
jgi:hypothetical protein